MAVYWFCFQGVSFVVTGGAGTLRTAEILKPRCLKPPGHYICTPEPGRLGCVISIQNGVNCDAYRNFELPEM